MNRDEVIALMESSTSEVEWNSNAEMIKVACGGYPSFWFKDIVMGGVLRRTVAKWGGRGDIGIIGKGVASWLNSSYKEK